jgi:N-acetyl-gamma-glutamylphosphate reductase
MKYRAFVDGQEGTTGLRIHEYLAQRSDIEVLRIDADKRKDAAERARLLNAWPFCACPTWRRRKRLRWSPTPRLA